MRDLSRPPWMRPKVLPIILISTQRIKSVYCT